MDLNDLTSVFRWNFYEGIIGPGTSLGNFFGNGFSSLAAGRSHPRACINASRSSCTSWMECTGRD
jgi:hypothetical protein